MKKYLLEMPDDVHSKLKIESIQKSTTMNQIILDSVTGELNSDELYHLLKRAYNFVKGGPSPKLTEDLKAYCDFYASYKISK